MGKIIKISPYNEKEISGMRIKVIEIFDDIEILSPVVNESGKYIKGFVSKITGYNFEYAFIPDKIIGYSHKSNYFVLPFGTLIELIDVPPHTNCSPVDVLTNDSQNTNPILNTPDNEPTRSN